MKIRPLLFASVLALTSAIAQPQPPAPPTPLPGTPPPATFSDRLNRIVAQASGVPEPVLARFSLDFPGGTPKQLVAAIEKAMGRPLNVIIAEEHANVKLPPLKMTDVNVPQLFTALAKISYKYDGNRNILSGYGFETETGQPTEDSIWRFVVYSNTSAPSTLTRFNLNFAGGTPKQLVAAIEEAMGKPLNVVIPGEHADVMLPPLKMTDVNVSVLFQALTTASRKTVAYATGTYGPGNMTYQQMITGYGFRTEGVTTDASIWSFYVEKPNLPPVVSTAKGCRFYALTPYLDRGMTVDDITTAIQTGWKMLGEKDTPTINFHKDTKLLIAVGEPGKLETIDSVLKALQPVLKDTPPAPVIIPAPQAEKKPKAETQN